MFKGDQALEDGEEDDEEEPTTLSHKDSTDAASASQESDTEPSTAQKEPRMKTNKASAAIGLTTIR